MSKHGAWSSRSFQTGWGALAAEEGREATYAERSRKHKTGLGYSSREPLDFSLHWAPALGPAWTLGSRISCYKTLISLRTYRTQPLLGWGAQQAQL